MQIRHENIQRNYTVTRLQKELGFAHWHQRVEFVYVLEGACDVAVGNIRKTCKAGDMAVIHSGEIHSITDVDNSVIYVCTFDPELIHFLHPDVKYIRNYIDADMLQQAKIANEIKNVFHEMYDERNSQRTWNDVLIRSDILRIYTLLVRYFERDQLEKPQNPAKLQQFQLALQYIEDHYAQSITLAQIAHLINYNASYTSSLFVSYTGLNFKTYLDSFRVHKAVKMIKSSDETMAEISTKCGFANIRTFNNVFRKVTGMTPSELRGTES